MNEITRKYFDEVYMKEKEEYIESFVIDKCESPIEELFALALHTNDIINEIWLLFHEYFGEECEVVLTKQHLIDKYRVDFFIQIMKKGQTETAYIIELDGHDFHEKTKEQVKRRNERDRFFASNGMTVIRFSGSEVYNNPDECVESVCECIIDNEIKKERGK